MLDLERCREILGNHAAISDDRLRRLREEMYLLANVLSECVIAGTKGGVASSPNAGAFDDAAAHLPMHDRDEAEERAAILEFEGGFSRDEAERRAITIAIRRRRGHDT